MGDRLDLKTLVRGPTERVLELFEAGVLPNPESLSGYEFLGFNLPKITQLLGFQKFRKGFYRVGSEYWGYNVPVRMGNVVVDGALLELPST